MILDGWAAEHFENDTTGGGIKSETINPPKMAKLKPCPFCGRIPMVEDCGDNRFFVRCKCGIAQDKLYGQRCDAVRRWNTRKLSAEPQWIPCSERLPSKEERKEWIDNNLDGIGYLYPCLVTRYSSINPDRTKNNLYVAKHYFDGEDFLNAGEEVCSEYIIAWMPLPKPYKEGRNE